MNKQRIRHIAALSIVIYGAIMAVFYTAPWLNWLTGPDLGLISPYSLPGILPVVVDMNLAILPLFAVFAIAWRVFYGRWFAGLTQRQLIWAIVWLASPFLTAGPLMYGLELAKVLDFDPNKMSLLAYFYFYWGAGQLAMAVCAFIALRGATSRLSYFHPEGGRIIFGEALIEQAKSIWRAPIECDDSDEAPGQVTSLTHRRAS